MNAAQNSDGFQVDQIDHVELYVPDRQIAANWYYDTLGIDVIPEYADWAKDPRGPLMIGTKQGNTKLALFEGNPSGSQSGIGFHLVAFRVSARSFVQFVSKLPELNLKNEHAQTVDRTMVSDHGKAYSIYFCDPFGHQLEITTYDYEETSIELNRRIDSSAGDSSSG